MSTAELDTPIAEIGPSFSFRLNADADSIDWKEHEHKRVFECPVLLCEEEEGGFSAHALTLAGVVSQGESEAEAMHNIAEALQGAIETYLSSGQDVPWSQKSLWPSGKCERWIVVNV